MATVNLGLIKFRWQGAYAGATAYVKDDVVSYNGSSYVCILASTGNLPTDTTYWNVMAQGGTDITSLSGLAQGDILYYNGTDWVRLGAGTSGQLLQTGGSGANPSWTDAPSGVVKKIEHFTNNTRTVLPSTASKQTILSGSFTTTTASSKVQIHALIPTHGSAAGAINMGITWNGTDYDGVTHYVYTQTDNYNIIHANYIFDSPSTAGSVAWGIYYDSANASSTMPNQKINPNSTDDGRLSQTISSIVITEFKNN